MADNRREISSKHYRLTLVDALSHRRLGSLNFTKGGLVVVIVSSLTLLLVGAFLIVAFTPLRTFIPGYPDEMSKRTAVQNAIKIDSLETKMIQWELYVENLKRVIAGDEPVNIDSLVRLSEAASADCLAGKAADGQITDGHKLDEQETDR